MQLYNMDCTGRRSNQSERDPDLGEDLSRDIASDDDIRDCDSIDGDHHVIRAKGLNVATLKRQHSNSNNSSNNKNRNIHSNHKNNNNNNSSSAFVGDMSFVGNASSVRVGVGSGMGVRSPDHHADLQMSHHHQFPTNHPLNALGNFMGIGGLHGIPNLQHNDVLEKLKMQVRDMKVGLMEQDYAAAAHAAAFGQNLLPTSLNPAFSMPPTSMAQFEHRAQSLAAQAGGGGGGNGGGGGGGGVIGINAGVANGNSQNSQHTGGNNNVGVSGASCLTNGGTGLLGGGANGSGGGGPSMGGSGGGVGGGSSGNGGFSFTSPTAPSSKDVNPASNSSTSSEASNSSQQNNAWSFEEQYKQVRQLYEINDDPKRKEFLDDLFSFMQKRGTPINRLPIMAKSVLDLYELYNLVIARGGLVDVINKKLWQEIIKGLHLPSSITSAAFTLRTQYMKYLYPYECDKKNLSTPAELQAAIDGNRREGRRSSYGQYEAMHTQMQMPQIGRPTLPGSIQQMSPLALVTHAANNQQAQAAAAAAAAHHRLMAPSFGQMPNLMTHEFEQRMMEYIKLIQVKKEQQNNAAAAAVAAAAAASGNVGGVVGADAAALARVSAAGSGNAAHMKQQQHQHSASPEPVNHEAMNALDISRVAFWQMYHNNTSPPTSINTSPQGNVAGAANIGGVNAMGVPSLNEQNEALNLSDSPPNINNIKREREREQSPEPCDRDDFHNQSPPAKRGALNFPTGFYLPPGMAAAAAAAAAANFHQQNHSNNHLPQDSDGEDGDDDADTHNTTNNSMAQDEESERPALNGHHLQQHHLHQLHHLPHNLQMPHHQHLVNNTSGNHDKSDDSAIENSPSTSAVSAGGGGVDSANDNGACGGSASGHISPVSTKKIHLSKQQNNGGASAMDCSSGGAGRAQSNSPSLGGVEDALNLLSGMQFRVARNGTNANGEQQLTVNLELNGVKYSGVLIANTANNTNSRAPSVADLQQNKSELMENNELTDATADEAKDMSAGGTSGADADIEDEDMADMASTTSTDEASPTKLNKNVGNALTAINNNGALNDSNVISDTVMSAS
ncbi:protein dead ringer isoform X2 [Zeugodacus cucurbitae]|uniref:protein dead ringer isoform X2 n=1 Tax=Zeugodacus cucurbitae TaxID=28588 RepID=UPI0023D9108F|nr:protein dead ringer isoform X2 [Zeugodacus cucurbitae]